MKEFPFTKAFVEMNENE